MTAVWKFIRLAIALLTLKLVADVRRQGVRIMADQENINDELDTLLQTIDTETNRLADEFKQLHDSLPAEGGLDARQTASLKARLQQHEAVLRAIGADADNPVPTTPPNTTPTTTPEPTPTEDGATAVQ